MEKRRGEPTKSGHIPGIFRLNNKVVNKQYRKCLDPK